MNDALERLKAALADRYAVQEEVGAGELAAVLGTERFLNEIKVTATLQHPHILPLFDSGEAASFLFYVMPYIEGESLGDRLTRLSRPDRLSALPARRG